MWLSSDVEAPHWWTLDMNGMLVIDMQEASTTGHASEAWVPCDAADTDGGIKPLDTFDGLR